MVLAMGMGMEMEMVETTIVPSLNGNCVILQKNKKAKTVVNKVGTISNEFRVFDMEILAGIDDLNTELVWTHTHTHTHCLSVHGVTNRLSTRVGSDSISAKCTGTRVCRPNTNVLSRTSMKAMCYVCDGLIYIVVFSLR